MKYLKKFESSEYYFPTDHAERERLLGTTGVRMGKNKQEFTQSEKEELVKLLNSIKSHFVERSFIGATNFSFEFDKPIMTGKHGLYVVHEDDIWIIDKVKDEWFLVAHQKSHKIYTQCYTCDQFEGLLQFIKDNIYY